MKAVYYEEFGGPDVLQFGERPTPQIAADEILVRVSAAGVNPIDRRLRGEHIRQDYFTTRWPITPGWDFSGVIAKVGPLVQDWQEGDEVAGLAFSWHLHYGTYAEYVPVKASSLVRKPDSLSFTEAAALPLVSLTAWQALTDFKSPGRGQSVFIQAGAGGVGSVAISMAKHLGASVYTTCSASNADYAASRGADVVVDYTTQDYVEAVLASQPHGVDFALEVLQREDAVASTIKVVKDGGTLVCLSHPPPDSGDIVDRKIDARLIHHRVDADMLDSLLRLYADGQLKIPDIETMALSDAAEAHRKLETWHVRGKIVLVIDDGR